MYTNAFLCTIGILLPFLGTAVGAGAVWLVPGDAKLRLRKVFYGFAAGVMLASLVWSLLIPAMEQGPSPLPAFLGFFSGFCFFLFCEGIFDRAAQNGELSGTKKMIFAVTLHNLPEGMAVGVAFAGVLTEPKLSVEGAMLLSVGIALQNLPEGSIISTPLASGGSAKSKAFGIGVLSGIVEPIGAILALLLTRLITGILPFVLSFAAGAMLYVAADELIPALSGGTGKRAGLFAMGAGFAVMMAMDVIFA